MGKKRTRSETRMVPSAPDRRRAGKLRKLAADAHKRYGGVFRRLAR